MLEQKPRSAVLVVKDHKLLLIKRIKGARPVYYVLPGGGIEAGETPEQAAIREMKEELGVNIYIEHIKKDIIDTSRETWIAKARVARNQEPVWQEDHKQKPDDTFEVVWLPIDGLQVVTIFPKGTISALVSS
jgi:8-oxo-dGTP diphosphatase